MSVTTFTDLEAAVLRALCDEETWELSADQRRDLKALLSTAELVARDNTGHGFYTSFKVDPASAPGLGKVTMIPAPNAVMVGLGEGNSLGFILWAVDGYPTTLEGFQYGDDTGQTVDLHQFDLADLMFRSIG